MTDWNQLEQEYITTGISCRGLAKKHGINHSTVSSRACRGGWMEKRGNYQGAGKRKKRDLTVKLHSVADKLLSRIETAVDAPEQMDTKDLRALVSALKDLLTIQEACPELEKQARVAQLQKQLEQKEEQIRVIFEAGEEEYNG